MTFYLVAKPGGLYTELFLCVGDGSSIHAVGEGDMDNNLSLD